MDCIKAGSLSNTISHSLLRFMSIESMMLSNCLILCRSLFLLPSIFPSIRIFSNESALWWPKYWSFSISPFNEYSGLISFRIDWFDLLAIQRALKRLLQPYSSKTCLPPSAFFMVQLSQLYMTTGKAIALAVWIFVQTSASLGLSFPTCSLGCAKGLAGMECSRFTPRGPPVCRQTGKGRAWRISQLHLGPGPGRAGRGRS